MGPPTQAPPAARFTPGFRLSRLDGAALLAGFAGTLAAAGLDHALAAGIGFTVAHFFLFCNVLRMDRALELAWAGTFVLAAAATQWFGVPGRGPTFAGCAALTLVLAWVQVRRPSYHGVGWRTLNPGLPRWWHENRDPLALSNRVQSQGR